MKENNGNIIQDDQRKLFFKIIKSRIAKGKSTLIIGKTGSGKTKFLEQLKLNSFNCSKIESLGSLNYILTSILRQSKYNFIPKINKSAEYLEAICNLKNNTILIDDINDLRPGIFNHIKRFIDAQIPVIMAGTIELLPSLKERHGAVFSRLRLLTLEPVSVEDFKKNLPQFEKDTLEFIFGFSFGNMWLFNEICEECLDLIQELKITNVSMPLANQIIQNYQQFPSSNY